MMLKIKLWHLFKHVTMMHHDAKVGPNPSFEIRELYHPLTWRILSHPYCFQGLKKHWTGPFFEQL